MRLGAALLGPLMALALVAPTSANVDLSPRPEPRPAPAASPFKALTTSKLFVVRVGFNPKTRPQPRPGNLSAQKTAANVQSTRAPVTRVAMSVTRKPTTTSPIGKICGDRKILGREVDPIKGKLRGCGVSDPVQVVEVSGVRLSQASTMNCATAAALKDWVEGSVKPNFKRLGGGVDSLKVAAHYSCRTRNHKSGAKISEHGKGNAIDISGVVLKDGTNITVQRGWNERKTRKVMRQIHADACGPFNTVLGPKADRYHKDHFHFDVARHYGGRRYCR